jgi:hypothetical protein
VQAGEAQLGAVADGGRPPRVGQEGHGRREHGAPAAPPWQIFLAHPILGRAMGTVAVIVFLSMQAGAAPVAPNDGAAAAPAVALVPTPHPDHRHQTGLALMPGVGYRIIVPYRENKDCGDSSRDASKRVCTNALPVFVDLQVSFGVTRRLDLLLDLRFGVAKDPVNDARQFAVAPGLRVWLDQDSALKLYTTVQGLFDSSDYHGVVASADFGLRNANGLMYDLKRNLGFYFQFGETLGLRRWFRMELDAGLGFQVRFP